MHINIFFLKDSHYWPKEISKQPSNSLKWFLIPRNYFDWFLGEYLLHNIKNHSIYFLLWKNENNENLIYVWETTNPNNRINDHIKKREWIEEILIFEFNENPWKTILQNMEQRFIQLIRKNWKFEDDNKNWWFQTQITPREESSVKEIIIEISILAESLGFDFLKPPIWIIQKEVGGNEGDNIWITEYYIENPKAKWLYDWKKMTVIKSSLAKKDRTGVTNNQDTINSKNRTEKLRNQLIEKNILIEKWDYLEFQEDYEFNSATAAAQIILCYHWSGKIMRWI